MTRFKNIAVGVPVRVRSLQKSIGFVASVDEETGSTVVLFTGGTIRRMTFDKNSGAVVPVAEELSPGAYTDLLERLVEGFDGLLDGPIGHELDAIVKAAMDDGFLEDKEPDAIASNQPTQKKGK